MYQIFCDGLLMHDVTLPNLQVVAPQCKLELNKTGLLTFQLPPTHRQYNRIKKHLSEIKLCQDGEILFCGRVLNDELTFDKIKNVECEGDMSYFLDTIQKGREYHIDGGDKNAVEEYFRQLIAYHNLCCMSDVKKQFNIGNVTVTDPNNYVYKISNYEDTLTVLNEKLLNTYGGYLMIRYDGDEKYIDYLKESEHESNQNIEFGKNIVNLTKYVKGEDIYTALIPLGATLEGTNAGEENLFDKRINIYSVNDETDGNIVKEWDYIYDAEAVEKWGWIWRVIKFDDITEPENLLRRAKEELKNAVNETLTLELTAIDLHLLNVDVDRIRLGDMMHCVSETHDIDTKLLVKSLSIDLDDPSKTVVTLVTPTKTIKTDPSITSNKKTDDGKVKETLTEDYPTYDWVKDNCLMSDADGNVDLSSYAKIVDVNNAFSELASALQGV